MAHGRNWRNDLWDEALRCWDSIVHALTVMDHEHRMIHDGMAFHATHRTASLANGGTLEGLIAVPAGAFPHMTGMLFTFGAGDLDIETFEGTTTSADGTAVNSFNRNRNSTNTPNIVLTHTPTITDDGTKIHDRLVPPTGAGVGNQEGVVSPNLGEEWILKPSTKYLVRVTNNSGGAIKVTMEILWYEPSYVN